MTLAQQCAERMILCEGKATAPGMNLAADLLELVASESGRWVNRSEDAVRIPDIIWEAVRELRQKARNFNGLTDGET